eukprot:s177_g25.t1
MLLAQGYRVHLFHPMGETQVPVRFHSALATERLVPHPDEVLERCEFLQAEFSGAFAALLGRGRSSALRCLGEGFLPRFLSLQLPEDNASSWELMALLLAVGYCHFKATHLAEHSLGTLLGDLVADKTLGLGWREARAAVLAPPVPGSQLHAKHRSLQPTMAYPSPGAVPASPRSSNEGSDDEDDGEAMINVQRAELVRGHRPVVVSEVPVYVALEDRDGRRFEDKGSCKWVKYRWMRGPRIQPCFYHPHKMSTIRDVAKTWRHYCSRECFLRGWHTLPQHSWNPKPEENEAEDPIAQWTEVGNSRQYSPTQNDIERPLRLDIIPLTKSGKEAKGKMTITTGTVIPTPKEARMRQMISNGGTFNAEWLQKQFKVFNWNILADLYATENVYPYCEKWALSWNWRKHLIIKEVKSMGADIITLQEVQKDAFDEWFKPELAADGYDGLFQQKKRDPIFHRGKYTSEGCATFWRVSRFKRVEKAIFDYDRLSQQVVRWRFTSACSAVKLAGKLSAPLDSLTDSNLQNAHSSRPAGFTMAPSHSCRLRRHACIYHQHKHKLAVIGKYSQKADCFDQTDLRRHAAHVASWITYGESGRIPAMDEIKLLKKFFDKIDGGRLPHRLRDVLSDMQSMLQSLPKPAHEAWNKAERQLQKSLRKLHRRGHEPVGDAVVVAAHDDFAKAERKADQDDCVQVTEADDSASPGTSAIADQHLRLFRKRNEWSFLDDSQKLERLRQAEQAARCPRSSLSQAELTEIINTAAACLAAPHRQAKTPDDDVADSEEVGTASESEVSITALQSLQKRVRSLLLLALRVWRLNQFDCHTIQHVLDFLQEKIKKFEDNVGQIQEAAAGKAWIKIKQAVDVLMPGATAPSSSEVQSAEAQVQVARDHKPYKAGVRLERQSGIQNISWSVVGAAWECREYSRKGTGWKAKTRTFKISKFLEQGLDNEAAVEGALQEAKAYREELVRQGKLKPPKPRPPRSTVRGVTFDISKKKWLVRLYHPVKKKHVHIGVFRAKEEAEAKARDTAKQFGIRSEYEVLQVKNGSGRGKSRLRTGLPNAASEPKKRLSGFKGFRQRCGIVLAETFGSGLEAEVAHHVRDQKQEEKVNQRLSKGNIALAVILEDRHMKNRHGAGHQLCVVNTHILCDPAAADVKLWQSHLLIKSIQTTTRGNMPTLVCGDFNSTPDSAVYDYFRRGQVRENHEDLKKDPCGLIRQLTLQHNVALATAYETCTMKEATFTNYTEDFKGTLDYIWFTPDNISVLAISQVDDEAELSKETALPSSTRPSDHVSLVATFMFQDPTPEQEQQQMGPLSRMIAQTGHGHRGMGHHLGPHYGHHGMHPGTGPGGGDGMYMGGMPYPQNYL